MLEILNVFERWQFAQLLPTQLLLPHGPGQLVLAPARYRRVPQLTTKEPHSLDGRDNTDGPEDVRAAQ